MRHITSCHVISFYNTADTDHRLHVNVDENVADVKF